MSEGSAAARDHVSDFENSDAPIKVVPAAADSASTAALRLRLRLPTKLRVKTSLHQTRHYLALVLALVTPLFTPAYAAPIAPCRIEVVEKGSGWPVPLVELRTTHNVRFVTDNAGVIAFDLPECMGRQTFFHVTSPGYEVTKDGFGWRGLRLTPEPGKTLKLELTRTAIAKRLGRLTGAGIFAESQKLGRELDWIESGIVGCDSVLTAVHRDKLFWAWGDTSFPNYPMGIFHASSATTPIQPLKSFEPPVRLPFTYFANDKGVPRAVAKMPGNGPTWLGGYTSLPDRTGTPRLVAGYVKINPPIEAYEVGLCVWNEKTENFEREKVLWTNSVATPKSPPVPNGHPVFWRDTSGTNWVYFGSPLPNLRFPATFENWQDPSKWESFKPQEHFISATDGKPVQPHASSIAWNNFRKRWVIVFLQTFGSPSAFGELWYAEAKDLTGPWGKAVKILSHDNYTFYNPRIHPEFTPDDSPVLLFEGTYTMEFANKPTPTPRYDYNQILYRLDLDDAALGPAQEPN